MANEEIYENDDLITLKSADGEDIDFVEIAGIALNGKFYALLQPVELLEGILTETLFVYVLRSTPSKISFPSRGSFVISIFCITFAKN